MHNLFGRDLSQDFRGNHAIAFQEEVGSVPERPCVPIAGVPISNVTMDEALRRIELMIRLRGCNYVVTPNVDHVIELQKNKTFQRAYRASALVVPDGVPLLWASKLLGRPLAEKVSGSDLFPRFCALAAEKGYRLFFFGGLPGAAERAAEILTQRYPGLKVVGTDCPPYGFEKNEAQNWTAIRRIRESRAEVLIIGLGAPKSEIWLYRHLRACQVPAALSVGASFDFVAGMVRRAPRILQRVGLEWLWRLALEPRRLYQRYLYRDPAFFLLLWRDWRKGRRRRMVQHAIEPARSDGEAVPLS